MADPFTRIERTFNWNGAGSHGANGYGCSCCRLVSYLNHHRKATRRRAKRIFARETYKEIQEGLFDS
jgi:hypothetical protein